MAVNLFYSKAKKVKESESEKTHNHLSFGAGRWLFK